MLIDWVTVGAQIVNFLILVAALKFLLYDRITRVMAARQEQITARMSEADQSRLAAQAAAARARRIEDDVRERRHDLLDEARRAADERRRELVEHARREIAEQRERWWRSFEDDRDRLLRDLTTRVGEEVVEVTERALSDLVGAELEEAAVEAFLRHLEELPPQEREALATSLDGARNGEPRRVVVHTSFDLPEGLRHRVVRSLDLPTDDVEIDFVRDPRLICGIEIRSHGRSVGWNVAAYLDALRRDLLEMLAEETPESASVEESS